MWLNVLTVLSCICFGFLLDVSSGNAESMDADLVKRINHVNATVKTMVSNYHELLKTVLKDGRTIDSLIKQNQDLNQRLNKTENKMEKLITNEESLNQTIRALQTLTSEQQRELNKEKSRSKKMESNYNDRLLRVNRQVDFMKNQNHYLEQNLNSTVEKMEKLMSEEETSSQNIVALQNITSQQQRDLDKEKSKSKTSRVSVGSSLILLNNSLQELTRSTNIGFTNLNGNDLKEKKLLREEMRKFEKRIKRRINKRLDNTVDGQWSRWIDTPSSATCGVGCRLRYRECSNPYPQQGGKKCTGSRNKHVNCLQYNPCPVHGAWSVWSENTCSVTCGVGTRLRSRNCSNPHPQYGGNNCTGNSTDHVTCTQPNECPVHGAWSVWKENTCSVTCGVGTRLRSRSCSNPHPQYGGNNCPGKHIDHVICTQPNKCPGIILPGIRQSRCEQGSCYPETGDLLIGREDSLSSTSTCGLHSPERYCIISHLEEDANCLVCDSRYERKSHNITNIVWSYGNRYTRWWQAEAGKQQVSIQLDLEAEFHFTHLIMTFKTFRPKTMLIERSNDRGNTWRVYRYFAEDCVASFPGIKRWPPKTLEDVICDDSYSDVAPSTEGEVIFRALPPFIPIKDPYNPKVQDLLHLTNLRVNFTDLHTSGDTLVDNRREIKEKYYYAVYEMIVRGSCKCYGHSSQCVPVDKYKDKENQGNMVHGKCVCTHNTQGDNCERCLDFYSDLPWKPAHKNIPNACQKCNCNNHATKCHFDPAVYEVSGNLSGGVCDDCQHNTTGTNCQECKEHFFKDPNRDIGDPEICQEATTRPPVVIRTTTEAPHGYDLVVVIDSSVSPQHFDWFKNFAKTLPDQLDVDGGEYKIGLMRYSRTGDVQFNLEDYVNDGAGFKRAVDRVSYRNDRETNTDKAIDKVRQRMFKKRQGDRDYARNFILLLTDNDKSADTNRVWEAAEKAEDEEIFIYTVGLDIGDRTEIDETSSHPLSTYEYLVRRESDLYELPGQLKYALRDEPLKAPPMRRRPRLTTSTTTTTTTTTTPQPITTEAPHGYDLVVVIDSSVSRQHFDWFKNFAKTLPDQLDVDGGEYRIGLMRYSRTGDVQFNLQDYDKNGAGFKRAVDRVSYRNDRETNTDKAIDKVRQRMFKKRQGDRDYARNFILLLTDNDKSADTNRVWEAAEKAEDEEIFIYTVGLDIGDRTEIDETSSHPLSTYEYLVRRESDLYELPGQLGNALRNEPSKAPPMRRRPRLTTTTTTTTSHVSSTPPARAETGCVDQYSTCSSLLAKYREYNCNILFIHGACRKTCGLC